MRVEFVLQFRCMLSRHWDENVLVGKTCVYDYERWTSPVRTTCLIVVLLWVQIAMQQKRETRVVAETRIANGIDVEQASETSQHPDARRIARRTTAGASILRMRQVCRFESFSTSLRAGHRQELPTPHN